MTLATERLTMRYDTTDVLREVTLELPTRRITSIVGANGCGKSTLLRALGRLLHPTDGRVLLDGHSIHHLPTKAVATRVGILPQSSVAPDEITVIDLVARGRHPHRSRFRPWSADDESMVLSALAATGTLDLADRPVDRLSGGQRQRVWLALTLAQDTEVLLLDEPTTFLDVAHQVELLDLLVDLQRERARTIVMVLHDLNLAARYSHHLVALSDGRVSVAGPPEQVVTAAMVRTVFGLESTVMTDPVGGGPLVVPIGRHGAIRAAGDR